MTHLRSSELKFSKFPSLIGHEMWKNLDISDILNLATNTSHCDWFANNVVEPPTGFSVLFVSSVHASQDHWEIRMKFQDRPDFVWFLYPTLGKLEGARMRLKIAGHILLSKEVPSGNPGEPPILYSFVVGFQKTIMEICDWLSVFFKRELTDIKIGRKCGHYELMPDWGQMMKAKDLLISDCQESQFITDLLEKRHAGELRTLIEFVEFGKPWNLSVECLSSMDYLSARINFSLLDSSYFIEYIRLLLQRDVPNFHVLRARIPEFTMEQIQDFKSVLNLEGSTSELRTTHKIRNKYKDFDDTSRMFQFEKNETTVFAFHFLTNKESQYTMAAVASWIRGQ